MEITEDEIIDLITRFNEALNAADVDGMMKLMIPGCLFENTYPPPDGEVFSGEDEVRAFWEAFFRTTVQPRIEIEEIFVADDRCVMRWVYRWSDIDGERRHVRGVDVYKIQDGLIAEKLSYVKG